MRLQNTVNNTVLHLIEIGAFERVQDADQLARKRLWEIDEEIIRQQAMERAPMIGILPETNEYSTYVITEAMECQPNRGGDSRR